MPANDIFAGFREDPYAAEARERWGATAERAQQRAAGWDQDTAAAVQAEGDAVNRGLAEALRAGRPVDDPVVQELVARHHAWVSQFWTPDRDAYLGLDRGVRARRDRGVGADAPRLTGCAERAGPRAGRTRRAPGDRAGPARRPARSHGLTRSHGQAGPAGQAGAAGGRTRPSEHRHA